jgi:1,4-alpha-glucan branching enzyme
MLDKMPGDTWRKFANLRLLYGYQWAHPGKKLLFMGGEFGQWREWSESRSLDWHLLDDAGPHGEPKHRGLQMFMRDLNHFYQQNPPLYEEDNSWEGFTWLDFRDSRHSLLSFIRQTADKRDHVIVACNFTPVPRENYRMGVPEAGAYVEVLNSDTAVYGGSNVVNSQPLIAEPTPWQDQPYSIYLKLPPLGIVYLKKDS